MQITKAFLFLVLVALRGGFTHGAPVGTPCGSAGVCKPPLQGVSGPEDASGLFKRVDSVGESPKPRDRKPSLVKKIMNAVTTFVPGGNGANSGNSAAEQTPKPSTKPQSSAQPLFSLPAKEFPDTKYEPKIVNRYLEVFNENTGGRHQAGDWNKDAAAKARRAAEGPRYNDSTNE